MNNRARSSLVQLLIAKSVLETLLVGTLAIGFFFIAFPPYYYGWGEATPNTIAGWVVNQQNPWQRVEVQLFIDDRFVASGVADEARLDLLAAGKALDEWHGFRFAIPALNQGRHIARVYALTSSGQGVRKSLRLVGDPIPFETDANGIARTLVEKAEK